MSILVQNSWRHADLLGDSLLNRTDNGFWRDSTFLNYSENRHANLFHMLGQMHRELFPASTNVATEYTRLILGILGGLMPALFNELPDLVDLVI